jgi:hypothetical protein
MRSYKITILALAAVFFAAGFAAGCTVAFDSNQEGLFPCETDGDCLDGYECDEIQKVCMEVSLIADTAPPCDQTANPEGDIDLDNDGYGTGDNRSECPNPAPDCDDADAERHPNNAELCDGADNNCDGQGADGADSIDEFDCTIDADCGAPPNSSVNYTCVNNQCALWHNIRPDESCQNMRATCDSDAKAFTYEVDGQTYHLLDENGELAGPIAECGG